MSNAENVEKREAHLELLLGRHVLDRSGKSIGRIEEVRAECLGDEFVIQEFLVGRYALFERLSAWDIGHSLLRAFGAKALSGYRVSWDKLDLADVNKPRLLCATDELKKISG